MIIIEVMVEDLCVIVIFVKGMDDCGCCFFESKKSDDRVDVGPHFMLRHKWP